MKHAQNDQINVDFRYISCFQQIEYKNTAILTGWSSKLRLLNTTKFMNRTSCQLGK